MASEHKLSREREVRLSMEQIEHSTNDKINEYTEQITLLKKELENMKNMVDGAVEYVVLFESENYYFSFCGSFSIQLSLVYLLSRLLISRE